jgi:hypothetical protein
MFRVCKSIPGFSRLLSAKVNLYQLCRLLHILLSPLAHYKISQVSDHRSLKMASVPISPQEFVDPRHLACSAPSQSHNPAGQTNDMLSGSADLTQAPDSLDIPPESLDLDWDLPAIGVANNDPSWGQFLTEREAFFAPEPCSYCRRHRLQCLIMATGPANPNPENSCSTCVGLFRGCSLARGKKRDPSGFETPGPVIGQLHGVNEEMDFDNSAHLESPDEATNNLPPVAPIVTYDRDKRPSSRRYQQTRLLRGWYDTHSEHPYPSAEDVDFLSIQSGLTKTQVNNWFTNARRRHRQTSRPLSMRHFRAGSPMPSMLTSPLDRWRNSPPEDDHVAPQAVAAAIASSASDSPWSADLTTPPWSPFPPSWQASDLSSQGDSASTSVSSLSSCLSHKSATQRRSRSRTSRLKPTRGAKVHYECTFCSQPFKKKHDWARHERAVHMPELETYTCTLPSQVTDNLRSWQIGQSEPQCSLCGHPSPDADHISSHDFDSCAERPPSQRTFCRKDHFWQHLQKYHGCQKWQGWDLDLNLWRNRQDAFQSYCGFCNETMGSWSARTAHIAEHFKQGLTMENWLAEEVLVAASIG